MHYIKRNLENVVNQVTKEYPVVLVTGPRQVGKTTMLQKLGKRTLIVEWNRICIITEIRMRKKLILYWNMMEH